MQAIIFCGIQASGKSTFYKQHFFHSHVRISLDLLRTRNREMLFLDACLRTQMRFVVDSINPTETERRRYMELAKAARYEVTGYFFEASTKEAVARNSQRSSCHLVPEKGIYGTHIRLQQPLLAEGFDQLYHVWLKPDGTYRVQQMGAAGDM